MSSLGKIFWSLVIIALAGGALAAQFIPTRLTFINQNRYTRNAGELTRDVLFGQTFQAPADNLSAIGIMFATYSNRTNSGEVRFYLRSSPNDSQDLRTAVVSPQQLGDNQLYRFEFEPLPDSKGKNYFFFVVSPDSVPGQAITVDLDVADPYPLGSAYIVREQGSAVTDPAVLQRSGKQTADLAFTVHHTVPLRVAVVNKSLGKISAFIDSWGSNKSNYVNWLRASLPAIVFFVVLWLIGQRPYDRLLSWFGKFGLTIGLIAVLAIVGFALRWIYATELPVTNDEGNYLYDAYAWQYGVLAGGDGYVKAPLVIAWIYIWQLLVGNTIIAGRLASIVAGVLTVIPIYWLTRDLFSSQAVTRSWVPSYLVSSSRQQLALPTGWGRRIGLVAAAIWLLFGAGVVFNIYVHTQPVALFFAVSGLAVLLAALRGTTPRLTFLTGRPATAQAGWFVLAGMLLGMGVASRKSVLALGLLPLLFILLESDSWRARSRHLLRVGVGFVIIIGLFLGGATAIYGAEGFWEALGFNSAEDGIFSTDPAELEQVRAYSLKGMTPFFRESLPLILLAAIGLGVSLEQLLRTGLSKIKKVGSRQIAFILDQVLPKLAWLFPWLVFGWAWTFFNEYEGAAFMRWGIPWLWYCFAGILLLVTILPRPRSEAIHWNKQSEAIVKVSTQPGQIRKQSEDMATANRERLSLRRHLTAALAIPLWVGGLIFFYQSWIKFHANYISEFVPPLVVLSAYGVVALYQRLHTRLFFGHDYPLVELGRRTVIVAISLVLLWSVTVSNYITFLYEHTGTFDQRAAQEAADWARGHIPPTESIFTGAALIPYLSGQRVALDIAHPRWYAYEFTRQDTSRLNTFLPPAEKMVQAFRDSQWVLHEQQTGFSFLMEYAEIEAGLEQDFVSVKGIENGSNTLTFYRRLR